MSDLYETIAKNVNKSQIHIDIKKKFNEILESKAQNDSKIGPLDNETGFASLYDSRQNVIAFGKLEDIRGTLHLSGSDENHLIIKVNDISKFRDFKIIPVKDINGYKIQAIYVPASGNRSIMSESYIQLVDKASLKTVTLVTAVDETRLTLPDDTVKEKSTNFHYVIKEFIYNRRDHALNEDKSFTTRFPIDPRISIENNVRYIINSITALKGAEHAFNFVSLGKVDNIITDVSQNQNTAYFIDRNNIADEITIKDLVGSNTVIAYAPFGKDIAIYPAFSGFEMIIGKKRVYLHVGNTVKQIVNVDQDGRMINRYSYNEALGTFEKQSNIVSDFVELITGQNIFDEVNAAPQMLVGADAGQTSDQEWDNLHSDIAANIKTIDMNCLVHNPALSFEENIRINANNYMEMSTTKKNFNNIVENKGTSENDVVIAKSNPYQQLVLNGQDGNDVYVINGTDREVVIDDDDKDINYLVLKLNSPASKIYIDGPSSLKAKGKESTFIRDKNSNETIAKFSEKTAIETIWGATDNGTVLFRYSYNKDSKEYEIKYQIGSDTKESSPLDDAKESQNNGGIIDKDPKFALFGIQFDTLVEDFNYYNSPQIESHLTAHIAQLNGEQKKAFYEYKNKEKEDFIMQTSSLTSIIKSLIDEGNMMSNFGISPSNMSEEDLLTKLESHIVEFKNKVDNKLIKTVSILENPEKLLSLNKASNITKISTTNLKNSAEKIAKSIKFADDSYKVVEYKASNVFIGTPHNDIMVIPVDTPSKRLLVMGSTGSDTYIFTYGQFYPDVLVNDNEGPSNFIVYLDDNSKSAIPAPGKNYLSFEKKGSKNILHFDDGNARLNNIILKAKEFGEVAVVGKNLNLLEKWSYGSGGFTLSNK